MKGFTLIEMLITIFIFLLAIGAIFGIASHLYKTNDYIFQQSQAIGEARRGIETMVKEIREAREGDDGSYIIEEAQDFEFIFYSDIDNDQETERVRYFLDGSDFKKGVIEPEGWPIKYPSQKEKIIVLSAYVRNQPPIFHYYDGDGNELSPPSRLKDTKLMKLNLVINVDPNRPPQDFTLESQVQIRNLKTNL
jgi:prepilin-type N-terminal cleavage/methylation domain-containing protein